jgi:hypothetical protein
VTDRRSLIASWVYKESTLQKLVGGGMDVTAGLEARDQDHGYSPSLSFISYTMDKYLKLSLFPD